MNAADDPVLVVDHLSKKFTRDLRRAQRYGLADIAGEFNVVRREERHLRSTEFWALCDVSFEVRPGEAVGVIGHNGAGKSTLLRVLNGLLRPDRGQVRVRGKSAAIIDLSTEFSPILTGRENIMTGAMLQGIERDQTDRLVEAVADFGELHGVLDAPVRTYSTGMVMRLGYGIISQLEPAVLLFDEVIAVGDIAFQRKCVQHISRYLGRGGAVVLVSHDLWMIQAICSRCLLMSDGRILDDTTPSRAVSSYLSDIRNRTRDLASIGRVVSTDLDKHGDEGPNLVVDAFVVAGPDGAPPRHGDPVDIEVCIRAGDHQSTLRVAWWLEITTANDVACVARLFPPGYARVVTVGPNSTAVSCRIPELPLFPGLFGLRVRLTDPISGDEFVAAGDRLCFEVESTGSRLEGLAQIPGALRVFDFVYSVAAPEELSGHSTST